MISYKGICVLARFCLSVKNGTLVFLKLMKEEDLIDPELDSHEKAKQWVEVSYWIQTYFIPVKEEYLANAHIFEVIESGTKLENNFWKWTIDDGKIYTKDMLLYTNK